MKKVYQKWVWGDIEWFCRRGPLLEFLNARWDTIGEKIKPYIAPTAFL